MANPGPSTTSTNASQLVASNQALRLLCAYRSVNVNAIGDTVLPIVTSTTFSVAYVIVTNASVSLTTASAGLFSQPLGAGTAIVANAALTANTSPQVVNQRTVASTNTLTQTMLYFNVATPQGAAATCDLFVYGFDFS